MTTEYINILDEQAQELEASRPKSIHEFVPQTKAPTEVSAEAVNIRDFIPQQITAQPQQPAEEPSWWQKGLGWFQEHVEEPWAAGVWGLGAGLIPGEQAGEAEMKQALAGGESWLQAARTGWTAPDRPWWQTLPAEMSLPLYWVPVGGWAAKGGALGARAALAMGAGAKVAKGIETVAKVPLMGEKALGAVITAPFKAVGKGVVQPITRRIAQPELDRMFQQYEKLGLNRYEALGDIPVAEGLTIPSVEQIMARVMRPTYGRAFSRQMAKAPIIGKPLRWELDLIDRKILMSSEVEARLMAENIRTNYAARFLPQTTHRLNTAGSQWEIWGTREVMTPDGVLARNVKVKPGQSQYIDDILENYTKYDLNPQQLAWAKEYHAIRNEMLDLLKREGVTDFEPFRELLHAHRQGLGKLDEAGDLVMFGGFRGAAGRVGLRQPIEKIRVYPTQAEGVTANVVYNPNKIATLHGELSQMIKILRDKGIKDYIKPLGKTPSQRANAVIRESYKTAQINKKNATYVVKALQRVKRGERLPSSTIKAIQRRNPDIPAKILPEQMDDLLRMAKQTELTATRHLQEITPAYRRGVERMRKGGYDPTKHAMINHPAFGNRVFDKEVAEAFHRAMGDQADRWVTTVGWLAEKSRFFRAAVAALDFSAPFIQGLPLLGYNPALWTRMTLRQFEWFFRRNNLSHWMTRPEIQTEITFWRKYGLYQGTFEYYAGVGGIEKMVAGAGGIGGEAGRAVGRGAIRQTYGRGEIAFSGFGDAARIEMARGLRPLCKTEDDFFNVANSLNKMTGVTSPIERGIPHVQQLLEQATIFAPRYLGAGFSLVADIFRGGISGQLARESLGHFMAGGALIYIATCKALGQEPNFDPRSARFMTIPVGEDYIGVGGFMTSLIRFAADIATSKPEDYVFWPKEGEGAGDYMTRVRQDNPFIKFMYSKASPVAGIATGVVYHRDYFGEEFESIGDWARFIGDQTLPIAMQTVVSQEPRAGAPAFGAEVMGMRTFPVSESQRARDLQNDYAQAAYSKSWDELNRLQQQELRDKHPEIEQAWGGVKPWPEQEVKSEYFDQMQRAKTTYSEGLWQLQRAYEAGQITGRDFREQSKVLGSNLGSVYDFISNDPRYQEAIVALAAEKKTPEYVGDAAYDEYIATIVASPDLEDEWGQFRYDEYQRRIEDFRQKWGEDVWGYVQQRIESGRDEPPLMKELRQAREVMRPYWEIRDSLVAQYNLQSRYNQAAELLKKYPQAESQIMNYLGLDKVERYVSQYRRYLRETNPDIAEAYQKFYS